MKFNNNEDQVKSWESKNGNFIIFNPEECPEEGQYFYWLESTSPTENYGPFKTFNDAEKALKNYLGVVMG